MDSVCLWPTLIRGFFPKLGLFLCTNIINFTGRQLRKDGGGGGDDRNGGAMTGMGGGSQRRVLRVNDPEKKGARRAVKTY